MVDFATFSSLCRAFVSRSTILTFQTPNLQPGILQKLEARRSTIDTCATVPSTAGMSLLCAMLLLNHDRGLLINKWPTPISDATRYMPQTSLQLIPAWIHLNHIFRLWPLCVRWPSSSPCKPRYDQCLAFAFVFFTVCSKQKRPQRSYNYMRSRLRPTDHEEGTPTTRKWPL